MVTFDGERLFESGPVSTTIGGRSLRHDEQAALDGLGVVIAGQGISGRAIEQDGTLMADTAEAMTGLTDAIEAKLDGLCHTLVDETGRTWTDTVLVAFEPGAMQRVGPRWKVEYRVRYVQVRSG